MEFLLVLTAHFLGDFIFQPGYLAEKKKENIWFLFIHTVIYIIPFVFVFLMFGVYWKILIYIFGVLALHFLIDFCKIKISKKFNSNAAALAIFLVDLALHTAIIIPIAVWGFKPNNIYSGFDDVLFKIFGDEKMFYCCFIFSAIVCLKPASVFIKNVLAVVERKRPKTGGGEGEVFIEEINNAGSLIGQLERIIMLILGAMGLYSLIGLVLTAKSLARFKQFEKQNFAERYLIGTLLSLLVTALFLFVLYRISAQNES